MNPHKKALIEIIQQTVPSVVAIYLFGSAAREDMHADSDIDLAVLCPNKLQTNLRISLSSALSKLTGKMVDLIDLKHTNTVFQQQIISTGRCIFCADDSQRGSFETYVLLSYVELNERRKDIINDIKKRGSVFNG